MQMFLFKESNREKTSQRGFLVRLKDLFFIEGILNKKFLFEYTRSKLSLEEFIYQKIQIVNFRRQEREKRLKDKIKSKTAPKKPSLFRTPLFSIYEFN